MKLVQALPILLSAVQAYPKSSAVADVEYATYAGTVNRQTGVTEWLGIRYAAPPLGDLRFRAPAAPLPQLNGTIIANTHGPVCLATNATAIKEGFSEDCLFLDIYAPTQIAAEKLYPVYVFLQGGGFNKLSAANFNGTSLIQASDYNIVTVTFNYRVGPYGFLTSKEVQQNGDLNVGLLDQRGVFKWVQENIAKFGGDPTHVTIGGDSAGGASVDLHLSAYGGRDDGLFHAAAAESQSFGPQFTVDGSQYQYDALVQRTGCSNATDTLQCLRELPIEVLQGNNTVIPTPGGAGGYPNYMYSNVIDGDFTQTYTYEAFQQGKFINVPVIYGDVTDEGTIVTNTTISSQMQMNDFLKDNFPNITSEQFVVINNFYPIGPQYAGKGSWFSAGAAAYGDIRYTCPGMFLSSAYANASESKYGKNLSWNYHYNVTNSTLDGTGYGVEHAIEVLTIWGIVDPTLNVTDAATNRTAEISMQAIIQGYWTSFIRSKNPNTFRHPGTPEWNPWNSETKDRIKFQLLDGGTVMETAPASQIERCDYLTSIGIDLQQ